MADPSCALRGEERERKEEEKEKGKRKRIRTKTRITKRNRVVERLTNERAGPHKTERLIYIFSL